MFFMRIKGIVFFFFLFISSFAYATQSNYSISGSDIFVDITATPPFCFEVSPSTESGYANSIVLCAAGTFNNTDSIIAYSFSFQKIIHD
jgi:hypothetical protein